MEEGTTMRKHLYVGLCLLMLASLMGAAADGVRALKGTVKKVEAGSKTLIVETADGTEHALHFLRSTAVHGLKSTTEGARATVQDLTEGSDVVVHYTRRGAEEIAVEVDNVGTDGLKRAEGTVARIDRVGKRLIVKTAEGTEETYRLAAHAAQDVGQTVVRGAEQSGKVVVYYADEGGRKVAYFFEKAF